MKSYTDIEQSRKLTEILPPESADMYYYSYMSIGEPFYMSYPNVIEDRQRLAKNDIPCWSLTALLGVISDFPALTQEDVNEWMVCVPNCNNDEYIEITAINPVDACYEMIIKLHELNLL